MPRRTPWLDADTMPNVGSPYQTPASVYIDSHYYQLQLNRRWNWFRYVKLCRLLKMTPYELASLVMLSHANVDTYQKTKKLKSRSVALLLTILEANVIGEVHHDVIKNPFPNLNKAMAQTPDFERPVAPPKPWRLDEIIP